jgi:hypothetical protein
LEEGVRGGGRIAVVVVVVEEGRMTGGRVR